MKIIPTKLPDCYLFNFDIYEDKRGAFRKLYHSEIFTKHKLNLAIKEQFYSISAKNVLRGMHFQAPPFDHFKLVSCLHGNVLDVVLDLRKNSKAYKQFEIIYLSQNNGNVLYIPSGIAHGFLSLDDNSGMLYNTTTVHAPEEDKGILWDSFGFNWPIVNPIVSERDQKFPKLNEFKSPF